MSQLKIEVVGADAMTLADEVAQQLRVMLGVESTPRRCSDDGTRYELPLSVELVGSWVLGERDERVKQWAAVQQWATDRLGKEQQRVQVSGGWLVNHPLAGLNGEDLLDAAVDLRDGMRVVRLMMRDGLLRAEIDEQLVHERRLTEQDGAMLEALATEYAAQVELGRTREMLGLGRRLGAWLDGESGWWSSVAAAARGTVGLEVCVADPGESLAGAVLHAPWELIAGQTEGFWAIHPRVRLAVWRRLGRPVQPALRPPTSSLSVLFMAASPAGVSELDYEQEETAVLRATEGLPLDLFVEETGTVEELGEELSRLSEEAPVQVMHLSCHGSLGTTPTLQLETLTGECHEVTAAALLETLDLEAKQVQLLFVSACLTARPGEKAVSLTQSLVQAGVPAALGWAGSVYDREASAFAAALYKRLSGGLSVARAVAKARLHLYEQWQRQGEHSQHWHLARVLLGPEGGGALASPRASRK